MHTDIESRLQDTVPDQLPPLDHDRLQRRGRRRRHVKRAGALAGVAAVVAAAVVAFPWPGGDVTIDGGFAGSGEASGQQQDAVDWTELSVTEAIDRLIAINEEAPAQPELTEGRHLLLRGYAATFSGRTNPDGTTEAYLSIAESQARIQPDRSGTERHEILVERIPVGTPADDIRAKAVEARDLDDQDAATVEETVPTPGKDLDAIAEDIASDTQPQPGQDDRPSQVTAFLDLHNILPILHQPADRIRALELIGSIDRQWVEYRPHAEDLLGRTGVGIAGVDGDRRYVIIFDPESGAAMGTINESPWDGQTAVTGMSAITEREIQDS